MESVDTSYRARFYTVPKVADNVTLQAYMVELAGGFTVTYGIGGWRNDDGQVITEPQATLEVLLSRGEDVTTATTIVESFAMKAGEEAVLRTVEEVGAVFLDTTAKVRGIAS